MSVPYSDIVFTPNFLFYRIKNKIMKDDEELRYDGLNDPAAADIYIGLAPDGSATSATVWSVVRIYFSGGDTPVRERIKTGIAWDDRANAGNWT